MRELILAAVVATVAMSIRCNAAQDQAIPGVDACKLFDDSGYRAIDKKAARANDLIQEDLFKRRDAARASYLSAVDKALASSGVVAQIFEMRSVPKGIGTPAPYITFMLLTPGCQFQVHAEILDTPQAREPLKSLTHDATVNIRGSVKGRGLVDGFFDVAITQITLNDGTKIATRPLE